MNSGKPLSASLKKDEIEILKILKDYGLNPPPVKFVVLNSNDFIEKISYSGMPIMYPHWKFGMKQIEFERIQKYGLSRFYELVINSEPSIAYLLDENADYVQKMVIAHVYGHADFFKNNRTFKNTRKDMDKAMIRYSGLVESYISEHGLAKVENFLEVCFSLENLIDHYGDFESFKVEEDEKKDCSGCSGCGNSCENDTNQYKINNDVDYLDKFVNSEKMKSALKDRYGDEKKTKSSKDRIDLLSYLIKEADLISDWQRDLLSIVREGAYYFSPQIRTKVMNEGWACFWHKKIMEECGFAGNDIVEYADLNSRVLAGGIKNPYYLGLDLFNFIKMRWDKGLHGRDFEREKDYDKKLNWDTKAMKGLQKIFEVRECLDDYQFIDDYFDDLYIDWNKFFKYKLDHRDNWYKIFSRDPEEIRQMILGPMLNCRQPYIKLINGNYKNRKELLLRQKKVNELVLEPNDLGRTLINLYKVWQRPVHIICSNFDGKGNQKISFDGSDFDIKRFGK